MPDERTTYASERELDELRAEVRRLREQQESQKQSTSSGNGHADPAEGQGAAVENKPPEKPHPGRKFLILGAILVLLVVGLLWWLNARHFEDTDDAEVDGHISAIASRVSGVVSAVYVEENQFVKVGQVLVDIDPRDSQTALEQARSQLSQAQSQTLAEQPNLPVTQVTNRTNISTADSEVTAAQAGVAAAQREYDAALAKVREAEANNIKAQADVGRYRPLADKDEVPREQFDQVLANAKALAATVASSQATAAANQREVEQRQAQLAEARQRSDEARQNAPNEMAIRHANVATRRAGAAAARAQLDQALLNLSYCKIISPIDGIVAKRTAEVGQHLTPGQQVVLVTQINDLWVTANFRETQLRRMHDGQPVRIHVDSLDLDFNGSIESMPAATGAITSLLPPENATGNYVKVVQRLPVRIRFDPNQSGFERLRPGMSVEPRVRVR